MSKAISFLAGLGAGYFKAEDKKKDDARRDERDARDKELYDEGKADRAAARDRLAREEADLAAIRAAAAPVDVQITPGQAMPAEAGNSFGVASTNPTVGGYKVGANQFAAKGIDAANAAAATQNTEDATRKRVYAAYIAQGKFIEADKLATSGLQARAAEGSLKEQEELRGQREFARGVASAIGTGGWAGFAKFATDKYNDDNTYTATEDGKGGAIVVATDKSGKQIGSKAFASPEDAIMFSVGRADPTKWAEYKVKRDDKKAAQDATNRGLDIQKQNADATTKNAETNERYRKDMEQHWRMRRAQEKAIAEGKAKAGAPITVSLNDMRDFEGDVDKYIKDQFPTKDGEGPKERAQINAQATAMKANASSVFQTNAAMGIPLTAGTVLQALEAAKDPKNVSISQGSDGTKYKAVEVNGTLIAVSGPLEKKAAPQATAPVAAPPAVPNAAATARSGVSQPPAPTARQEPPRQVNAIDQIQNAHLARMAPLAQQYKQAEAMFIAAAKSGDQQAVTRYMQHKEGLRKQLEQQAQEQFGNGAAKALQRLMAN